MRGQSDGSCKLSYYFTLDSLVRRQVDPKKAVYILHTACDVACELYKYVPHKAIF